MISSAKIYCVLILTFAPLFLCDDYYELLGILKNANNKEIRKAFKKLALVLHPDKNPGNEEAHEKFVIINRAYEVLKDGELRKKYDLYGEEGLDESKQQNWGRKFHSFHYYQNDFGIYDEDPEIITLSASDFEESVTGSADTWFINFYSPQCSHCHTLAPVWRKFAVELEGVVRIGAVNCGEDWQLCQKRKIHSFPSLILFPDNVKFNGERELDDLVSFILKKVPNKILILNDNNYKKHLEESHQQWLIFFCDFTEDCIDPKNKRKLSVSLNEMITVADVNCEQNVKVCKHLKKTKGTHFYSNIKNVENSHEIDGYDTKDITSEVLKLLPDMETFNEKDFKGILERLSESNEVPWLFYFYEDEETSSLEFKKLSTLLHPLNVGQVNCRMMRTICNSYHVHNFPAFVVFKSGGGHETYHGRMIAHDIAIFARESATSPVKTLEPKDFNSVLKSSLPYFVDFYAPWCPPCKQLLPEWRKAAKLTVDVAHFGTMDCTIHTQFCNERKIRSYPTAILYNNSNSHQYHGSKTSQKLVEFIDDVLNPAVIELDSLLFEANIHHKKDDELWVVDFFSPWCGPCQQLSPEWRKLAKLMKTNSKIHVAQVDCAAHEHLCQKETIRSYPSIRLYPLNSAGGSGYKSFNGWNRNAESIKLWIHQHLPSQVKSINYNDFIGEVINDKKPWLIDFYAPWCGHCQTFAPTYEQIYEKLKGQVNVAKLDCDRFSNACQQADVNAYPTIKFYAGAKNGLSQSMWGEEIGSLDYEMIMSFVERRMAELHKHLKDEL